MTIVWLCVLLAISVPIAYAVAGVLLVFMATGDFPYHIRLVTQHIFGGLNSFPLLAIPLFILAGELMNASGITDRIVRLANAFVGHLSAGLAHVNIWASVIFAGLSGSAVADTSALGRVFIPSMEKQGYPRSFAAALTAASAVIGPIIPPSIPVIIYALIVTGVSVPGLFLGGVVPGLLLALGLSVFVHFYAGGYAAGTARHTWRERAVAMRDGVVPLFMPVFVVGSILAGIVTPTEAATLAVAYALVVGLYVFRTVWWRDLPGIFANAMRDSAVIMMIIGAVAAANWLMTFNRVPNDISTFVLTWAQSPATFLIAVMALLLVAGLFVEGTAAMLVLVPILHPIALQLGIDATHFAIIAIFGLMIGLITPPLGLCIFVADSIAGVGLGALTRRIVPLVLVEIAVLVLLAFVPWLVTALPHALGY